MPELKYVIKTEADLSAARQLTAEFDKQTKQIKAETAAAGELKDALKSVEQARHAQAAQVNAQLTAERDRVSKSAKDSASVFQSQAGDTRARVLANLAASKQARESSGFGRPSEIAAVGVAVDQLGQSVDRATNKTDSFTISKQKLKGALNQVANAVPGVGNVIRSLLNPYALVVAAIAAFVAAIMKKLEALRQVEQAAMDTGREVDDLNRHLNKTKTGFDSSTKAAEDFADALQKVHDEANGVDDQLRDQLDAIDRKADEDREVSRSNLDLEESKIDEQVASGAMTQAQGAEAKRLLRKNFADDEKARRTRVVGERKAAHGEAAIRSNQEALDIQDSIKEGAGLVDEATRRRVLLSKTVPSAISGADKRIAEIDKEMDALPNILVDEAALFAAGPMRPIVQAKLDADTKKREDKIRALRAERADLLNFKDKQQGSLDSAITEEQRRKDAFNSLQQRGLSSSRNQIRFGKEFEAGTRTQESMARVDAATAPSEEGAELSRQKIALLMQLAEIEKQDADNRKKTAAQLKYSARRDH